MPPIINFIWCILIFAIPNYTAIRALGMSKSWFEIKWPNSACYLLTHLLVFIFHDSTFLHWKENKLSLPSESNASFMITVLDLTFRKSIVYPYSSLLIQSTCRHTSLPTCPSTSTLVSIRYPFRYPCVDFLLTDTRVDWQYLYLMCIAVCFTISLNGIDSSPYSVNNS